MPVAVATAAHVASGGLQAGGGAVQPAHDAGGPVREDHRFGQALGKDTLESFGSLRHLLFKRMGVGVFWGAVHGARFRVHPPVGSVDGESRWLGPGLESELHGAIAGGWVVNGV